MGVLQAPILHCVTEPYGLILAKLNTKKGRYTCTCLKTRDLVFNL